MRTTKVASPMGLIGVITALIACSGSSPPAATAPSVETKTIAAVVGAAEPPAIAEPAPEQRAVEDPPKPDVPPADASLERVMQAHFNDALLIRQAVIAGTPERAARPADALARMQNLDALPAGWRSFVARMREAAGRITDSTSAAQSAAAVADLGVSCGMCHERHGGPRASSDLAPDAGSTVQSRMNRHVWATERLWEGLFTPSLEAWNAGAKALSGEPFPKAVSKDGGVHARSAASDFSRIVARAPMTRTIEERAALYAELLVTCGACHRAMKPTD